MNGMDKGTGIRSGGYGRLWLWTLLGLFAMGFAVAATARSAPPRRVVRPAVRRPAARRTVRPRPVRPVVRTAAVKRIPAVRPVVVAGGKTVVVKEAQETPTVVVTEVPATPTEVETETTVTAAQTPSDTKAEFAEADSYEVKALEDGGLTAVLNVDGEDVKVRLVGLAPAKTDGPRARRRDRTEMFLRNLLVGEKVYVMYDTQVADDDEDGKYVACLYRAPDGLNVNIEAVRQGFAVVDPTYDFDDKATFLYYQQRAKQLAKGVWGFGRGRPGPTRRPAEARVPTNREQGRAK